MAKVTGRPGVRRRPRSPDPARLQQHIERPLRHRNPTDLLDLGAGHRLVVGDDRERLHRSAGGLALALALLAQEVRQIGCGSEGVTAGDLHEVHSTIGVDQLELTQAGRHVFVIGQALGEFGFAQRARRGEQQRLEPP